MSKEKSKKKYKIKKSKCFILFNILFILGCIIFYGTRLVYYYKVEHPKIGDKTTLLSVITNKGNVVSSGSGLYREEKKYTYKGKNVNNYVQYSGRLWRIVSVDSDNNIKLITDTPQTSLVWGINANYENSYANKWLNNDNNNLKSFYESLDNTDILVDTKVCIDTVSEGKYTCDKTYSNKTGLLSVYEYEKAGGSDSFLNIGEYWWTSNTDENGTPWYIYSKGTINNTVSSLSTYFSYGIRPTITIKGDTNVKSGNGTKKAPFSLDEITGNTVSDKYVGNYISYSGYTWRIIEKDKEYVKLVMDEVIKENDKEYITNYGTSNYLKLDSVIGKYLNETFYNTLENKEYILEHRFYTGKYDFTYSYDFDKITEHYETLKVGELQLGELFVTDVNKYFLATRTMTTSNNVYEVLEEGRIFAGSVSDELSLRPTLYIKPDTEIVTGTGVKTNPYVLG